MDNAFVSVPKDLSRVKTKIALNLTKRQMICFSIAGAIGIPIYFLTRTTLGNSASVLLMMVLMMPFFFLAMYEKDGRPAEKIICDMLRVRLLWSGKRPYKTENFYGLIEKEEKALAKSKSTSTKKPETRRKQKR
ncbi:MAG: PrgI family protein [Oscillospiraceae bacterium]|nr:PrgI family protein [Oscillospiraceae bacterium]